jgi:murein L,D-transpeptidase YcbB/YkuD
LNEVLEHVPSPVTRPLVNLAQLLNEDERYSFSFDGSAQSLDHLLVSQAMESLNRGGDGTMQALVKSAGDQLEAEMRRIATASILATTTTLRDSIERDVNPAAQRLYMYENGQVVDYMRVVAGRPDPVAQTPMMSAYIRYTALNPYWNSPADITARRLAPTILKEGRAYFKVRGYELLSDWSDHPRILDPMSIDWRAVQAGRVQARLRQKPGPANSMGRMKFMFPNKQGIWLHDTPEKEVLEEAARLQSNGCVRLEDAPRFARWLHGRPLKPQGAKPEQKMPLPTPVPIYLTYLTAVPSASQIVYFEDVYGLDRRDAARLASR